ncbi:MAG: DNA helicase, partial [Bacteroidaceae bacterium]|nr:DNA helicase [Bacteroidaceae bacterium]
MAYRTIMTASAARDLDGIVDYIVNTPCNAPAAAHLLDEWTEQAHATLVGPYAKLDYLLKSHHADTKLVRQLTSSRLRMRQVQEHAAKHPDAPLGVSQEAFRTDLQAVSLLVSLLTGKPVPASLQAFFPEKTVRATRHKLVGEYVRVLVEDWDETLIRGRDEAGKPLTVCYQDDALDALDRSYLRPLLYEGAQLNLLRPRAKDGTLYPELIILDPDYLVDISALSRCIEEFADSPQMYLLRKLEPAARSEAILLGTLSGQLLDEELHAFDHDTPYAESAQNFFRHHALDLITTDVGKDFHDAARSQQTNIRAVLREDLPQAVGSFDPSEVMVEPSFYSEMLGLQGRMDFLQSDMRLLIEQKSGKGAFVPYDPEPTTPKKKEDHYAQLLLYMALLRYNYRQRYEENHRELFAYLMYSKYRNALQGVSFAPELLYRTLRLRNRIVAAERRYVREGFGCLLTWNADDLNERNLQTTLWRNYKLPQIEATLQPLRDASPLERAYVLRMLQFVAREQSLAKLGSHGGDDSGFASTWHSTLDEKRAAGNIIDRLSPPRRSTSAQDPATAVSTITFSLLPDDGAENDNLLSGTNFRVGDIVFCYPYPTGSIPDARQAIVFRASIRRLLPDQIELRLRAEQADMRVFERHEDCQWAIEHDFMESAHNALYRGVYSLLSAPQERRDLLLFQRVPRIDTTRALRGSYGSFDTLQLHVKQATDLFLIIGPPGTGKTS